MTGATCFVCAKPANLRCSACAGKVEVSFCSKEHQKLAWPAHKLACGERAAPFMLPPFSEYEADRAMMACQVQASTPGQKSAQDLLKKALLPAQGMERYNRLRRLIGKNCRLVLNSPRKRDIVELVRANSASFWSQASMIPGLRPYNHPRESFILFHTAATALSPVPAPSGPADEKYDLDFYHRVLIYATLFEQATTNHERKAPFAAYTTEELDALATSCMPSVSPVQGGIFQISTSISAASQKADSRYGAEVKPVPQRKVPIMLRKTR
ncbi:hypothetical protein B0A53_05070 [Rhodotorula sp. CCFEE 5036]|nr:hypothetical protein B0A53_05070 [Rhodotorula sp. CCFEE 5036]